jgi:serine/threonine-protein kinase
LNSWEKNWKVLSAAPAGGQSKCFRVARRDFDGRDYFLKQLADQDNMERRRRFFIETMIYLSVDIEGIPSIVESNADSFKDKQVSLYYVSDFIDGIRLDDYVKNNNLSEDQVIDFMRQLLTILKNCHAADIVHRDIKPENIIIKNGRLFLVDFGIAYYGESSENNITTLGQEIGNRFLKLPEHVAGSSNKRDTRSDLTLAVGIALFMLTAEYPRTLYVDGKFPHQFQERSTKIAKLRYSKVWNIIFDRGFMLNISDRWNSAQDILNIIDSMREREENDDESLEALTKLHASKFNEEALKQLDKGITTMNIKLQNLLTQIVERAGGFHFKVIPKLYVKGEPELKKKVIISPLQSKMYLEVVVISRLIGDQVIGSFWIHSKEYVMARATLGNDVSDDEVRLIERELKRILYSALQKLI